MKDIKNNLKFIVNLIISSALFQLFCNIARFQEDNEFFNQIISKFSNDK